LIYVPYKNDLWIYNGSGIVQDEKPMYRSSCGTMYMLKEFSLRDNDSLAFPFAYHLDERLWRRING
jgi:hypothetical protein